MKLEQLMVDSKSAWFDYPGCPGFEVELTTLSRKEHIALRKACLFTKMNRKTHQFEEHLDDDKFVRKFANATVKDWKGFKVQYAEMLLPVDLEGVDPEKEIEYSADQAEVLVQNSTEFDNWLNDVVFDLDNFRTSRTGEAVEED